MRSKVKSDEAQDSCFLCEVFPLEIAKCVVDALHYAGQNRNGNDARTKNSNKNLSQRRNNSLTFIVIITNKDKDITFTALLE